MKSKPAGYYLQRSLRKMTEHELTAQRQAGAFAPVPFEHQTRLRRIPRIRFLLSPFEVCLIGIASATAMQALMVLLYALFGGLWK